MASRALVLQRALDRFAGRFLLPLVGGGEIEIGEPVGPGAIEHFVAAKPSDPAVTAGIRRALRVRAAAVAAEPERERLGFGEDEARLAVTLHNLLYASHPDVRARRRLFARVTSWTADLLDDVAPPRNAAAAALRHAVVGGLADLVRRDVHVTTWAYHYRYAGRTPPPRVVALPRLRRVQTEVVRVPLKAQELAPEVEAALGALVRRTPLTAALRLDLRRPRFRWHAEVVDVLRDVSLCRLATYAWLEDPRATAAAAGGALPALLTAAIDRERLAFVVAFHRNWLLTLSYLAGTGAKTVARLDLGPAPEAKLFYGTLVAATETDGFVDAPPSPLSAGEHQAVLRALSAVAGGDALAAGRMLVERARQWIGVDAGDAPPAEADRPTAAPILTRAQAARLARSLRGGRRGLRRYGA